MLNLFFAPLCIFAIPFLASNYLGIWIESVTGASLNLTTHLFNTLKWAFLAELMHSVLLNMRTVVYYRFLRKAMWYRRYIWSWLGRPIEDPAAWNLDWWAQFGFPQHEDPARWHEGHPAVKVVIFFMKMIQIHYEEIFLSGVTNWTGDMLIPPIGIKAELLPDFLKGRPIYNTSASLWMGQVTTRVFLEILLSVCLLGIAQVYNVYIHTLFLAVDEDGFRTWNVHDPHSRQIYALVTICQDMSMSILLRAAYQALLPLYLIARPMCNLLGILPYVSAQRFVKLLREGAFWTFLKYMFRYMFQGFRYKLSEYFPYEDRVTLWDYQWSIWFFLIACLVIVPMVIFSIRTTWHLLFFLLYHILYSLDNDFMGDLYMTGYTIPDLFAGEVLPIFDPSQGPHHLLFRNATPVPRLYQYEGLFASLAPQNRVVEIRGRQQFVQALGLTW